MIVSIQVLLVNGWDNNAPAFHNVTNWDEAVNLAYAISHQFGNTTVRLCKMVEENRRTTDYVGRLNGNYIQSTEANAPCTIEWFQRMVKAAKDLK